MNDMQAVVRVARICFSPRAIGDEDLVDEAAAEHAGVKDLIAQLEDADRATIYTTRRSPSSGRTSITTSTKCSTR